MNYGNVRKWEADLGPLFGPLEADEEEALLEELVQIDQRLEQLAADASLLVGSPYSDVALGVFHREVAGGPSSNDAGDLWFELTREHEDAEDRRWEVTASIIVFCDRELGGQISGGSCQHHLLSIESYAFTPSQAVRLLGEHVETVESDLRLRPAVDARRCNGPLELAAVMSGA